MANLDIPYNTIERIYPTQNDIAFTPYNGVNGSEINYAKNLINRAPRNAILSDLDGFGNALPTAGFVVNGASGLTVQVSRGRAYISGRYIEQLAGGAFTVTLDASMETYLYLQLNISGVVSVLPPARFITVAVAVNAVHAKPSNAVLIAKIITDATTVLSIIDRRSAQYKDSTSLYIPFGAYAGFGPTTPSGNIRVPAYNGEYACLTAYCLGWVSALVGIGTLTVRATGPAGFVDQLQVLPTFTATTISGIKSFPIFINVPTNIGRNDGDLVSIQLRPSTAILKVGTCSDVSNVVTKDDVSILANWSEWGAKA